MKEINKIQEPNSLLQHRLKQHSNYDNLPLVAKEELRINLLSEQGHICCYCMKRIPESTAPYMKVEHFKCQDNFPDLQLRYSNLLGACTGNEGQPKRIQTCDTRKGNDDFSLHPVFSNPSCNTIFKYTADGRIICNDEELQNEIDSILNLNNQSLIDQRAEVFDNISSVVESESKKQKDRKVKLKYFENLLLEWTTPNVNGKLKPFCMVAVYYLNKKIRQNQN